MSKKKNIGSLDFEDMFETTNEVNVDLKQKTKEQKLTVNKTDMKQKTSGKSLTGEFNFQELQKKDTHIHTLRIDKSVWIEIEKRVDALKKQGKKTSLNDFVNKALIYVLNSWGNK